MSVVTEMLKASSDICSKMIVDLTNSIIRDNTMPNEWNDSIIVSLYKGKGEALYRVNYRGLKLTEHILKVIKRITGNLIRNILKLTICSLDSCLVVVLQMQYLL